ncbi:MAG: hypothetical protein AB1498_03990 [bacterium]
METIKFKTHIEKNRIIKIPDSVILPEADVNVIVLIEKKVSEKKSHRWEHWIKEKVLSGGVIGKWSREEIYDR